MRTVTSLLVLSTLTAFAPLALAATDRAPAKPVHAPAHKPGQIAKSRVHSSLAKPTTRPQTATAKPTPRLQATRVKPSVVERPEPAPARTPEPHVTHNRKIHLEPDGSIAPGSAPANQAAVDTAKLPPLYVRGHLVMPPPLLGSHENLVRQNLNADNDGLSRIQDEADLLKLRQAKVLVPIPVAAGMQVDERLPVDRRYCRPWTAKFLSDLARAHYAKFRTDLQVNSAVRTVDFQLKLMRTNGNAAAIDGESASPHLTGQAVDLAKKGMRPAEVAWLRDYLGVLMGQGKIDVEEEFHQACFHISVYRRYWPTPVLRNASSGAAFAAEMHTAAMNAAAVRVPETHPHGASVQ